ncbi:hypothetical protein ACLKA6_002583 [Drosophila palustris]
MVEPWPCGPDRVFTAVLRLMPKYIQWPNVAERQQLVERTFEELPHCLGYIDGSEIKLFEKPAKCHEMLCFRMNPDETIQLQAANLLEFAGYLPLKTLHLL